VTATARAKRIDGAAPIFGALGDATRLRLVSRLVDDGPLSIVQLTADTKITRQGVTKHLRVLSDAGVVRDRWRGRERIWEIDGARLDVARQFLDHASQRWDETLGRLREFVEGKPG
jgi:DNA-binding transcriptional ArsR family regulator